MSQQQQASLPSVLFHQAPCGMAMLDRDGHINWANQTLAEMLGLELDHLTNGDGPPEALARVLQAEQDLVQLPDPSGRPRWLQRDSRGMDDESLLIVHDVTEQQRLNDENQRLRRQVEDLKLNDDLTGLPNKRAITQALELQISRSRRYQNPLSVVLVHIALEDESLETLKGGVDPVVLGVSRFLRDRLRWVDQIGRWDDNMFILVLPETEQADAEGLVQKIQAEQDSMLLPEPFSGIRPQLSFGIGCWHKGDDLRTLLKQVTQNLTDD